MTKLWIQLQEADAQFRGTRFQRVVDRAYRSYSSGRKTAARESLKSLPTKDQLLVQLVEKLKGKSVHKTLKRIGRNTEPTWESLKAMSSLYTHCVIECEKGNTEFRCLLPTILERLTSAQFELSSKEMQR